MKNIKMFTLLLLVITSLVSTTLPADDHVVKEQTRNYMGSTSPKRISEVWLSDNAVYYKFRNTITILRFDLGKSWTIIPSSNKYYEEKLIPPAAQTDRINSDSTFLQLGFNYNPEYEWVVKETNATDTVKSVLCKKIIADGDADYAHNVIEMWMSDKSPIDIARYYNKFLVYTLPDDWKELKKTDETLKNKFPMKTIEIIDNAIAPRMIVTSTVVTSESCDPPQGIYELPKDCKKVNSSDELYN